MKLLRKFQSGSTSGWLNYINENPKVCIISLSKSNGSKLLNTDVLSLFRHTNALQVLLYTIKLCRIYSYNEIEKKHQLFIMFFFLLLQFKRPTTKLGLVIALIFSRKLWAYMILDAQNICWTPYGRVKLWYTIFHVVECHFLIITHVRFMWPRAAKGWGASIQMHIMHYNCTPWGISLVK